MRDISAFFCYEKNEGITKYNKEKDMVDGIVDSYFLPSFTFSFLKSLKKAIKRLNLISLLPFYYRCAPLEFNLVLDYSAQISLKEALYINSIS